MFTRPENRLMNVVIDSFAPKLMYQAGLHAGGIATQGNVLPATAVAISPWFAKIFGVRQMSTEQMCLFMGYKKNKIAALLKTVKDIGYSPQFIGYGGTGMNTIHWLTEMCEMVHTSGLFATVDLYEPGDVEISNMLRFPKDPSVVQYSGITDDSTNKTVMLTNREKNTLAKDDFFVWRTPHVLTTLSPTQGKPFRYGAPGLAYRHELSNSDIGFISATHMGNSCSLYLNPTQDTDLQVESYGLIQLAPFFMNQLRLAIGLLEFLATNPDLTVSDTELMHHEFTGERVSRTDHNYHFQMGHSGNVSTEQEAANAV